MKSPWEKLAEESAKAFRAFQIFLELEPSKRSLRAAYMEAYNKDSSCVKSPQFMTDWSLNFKWKERALEYDAHYEQEFGDEVLKQTKKNARKWANRRDQVREDEWDIREKMLVKIKEILERGIGDFKLSQFPAFIKAFVEVSRLSVDMPTSKKEVTIKEIREDVKKLSSQLGVEIDPDEAIALAISLAESEAVH